MDILLVDDHVLFREGLAGLLDGQPDFSVVGQAGSVQEAIEMSAELQPDLILMDFSLPDGTGLDVTQVILAKQPETDIVFLTVHEEDDRLFAAIRSGAKGYLLKNVPVGVGGGAPAVGGQLLGFQNELEMLDASGVSLEAPGQHAGLAQAGRARS